ncbi:MAG: DUF3078 domain-containing protein, partial [Muribaculaceae bacterium]|nr:DUF3078 domain-containing protein [Muribaculaceae bacterium]
TIMKIEESAIIDSAIVVKESVKNDVISYLEKLAIFKGDSTVNDSIKAIIYSSITEYIMDIKDSSENPVSPVNPNFLSLVFNEKKIDTAVNVPSYSISSDAAALTLDDSYAKSITKSDSEIIIENAKDNVISNNPQDVDFTNKSMPKAPKNEKMSKKEKKEFVSIENLDTPSTSITTEAPPTPKLWKHGFVSSIQVSQAYISENWYQGGESNFNLISDQLYNVEYDHNNILFTTSAQWKLGISTAPSDTVHDMSINDDLFQINSKLGIKAVKDWYYTVSVLFKTQLFNSYPANSTTRSSAFFSPGEFNVGVGMSYNKKIAPKKFETSVMLAPLSYNLKFSLDKDLAAKAGIKDGKLYENQVGSSLEGTFKWEFYPNLTWTSRVFYFTDYKSALADIETGLNFVFNRFFSTRIYLQARFDDSIEANKDKKYMQFKELLSFGFNYKFK